MDANGVPTTPVDSLDPAGVRRGGCSRCSLSLSQAAVAVAAAAAAAVKGGQGEDRSQGRSLPADFGSKGLSHFHCLCSCGFL